MNRFKETNYALSLFNQVSAETYRLDWVVRSNPNGKIPFYRLNEMDVILHQWFWNVVSDEFGCDMTDKQQDDSLRRYIKDFGNPEMMKTFFGKS